MLSDDGPQHQAPLQATETFMFIHEHYEGFLAWGDPKSSTLMDVLIKHHRFWGTPIYGNLHIEHEVVGINVRP